MQNNFLLISHAARFSAVSMGPSTLTPRTHKTNIDNIIISRRRQPSLNDEFSVFRRFTRSLRGGTYLGSRWKHRARGAGEMFTFLHEAHELCPRFCCVSSSCCIHDNRKVLLQTLLGTIFDKLLGETRTNSWFRLLHVAMEKIEVVIFNPPDKPL